MAPIWDEPTRIVQKFHTHTHEHTNIYKRGQAKTTRTRAGPPNKDRPRRTTASRQDQRTGPRPSQLDSTRDQLQLLGTPKLRHSLHSGSSTTVRSSFLACLALVLRSLSSLYHQWISYILAKRPRCDTLTGSENQALSPSLWRVCTGYFRELSLHQSRPRSTRTGRFEHAGHVMHMTCAPSAAFFITRKLLAIQQYDLRSLKAYSKGRQFETDIVLYTAVTAAFRCHY